MLCEPSARGWCLMCVSLASECLKYVQSALGTVLSGLGDDSVTIADLIVQRVVSTYTRRLQWDYALH